MAKESSKNTKTAAKGAAGGGIYFVTYVGAAVYFVSVADGVLGVIWALLKALVWPGFLVNRVFELIKV